MKAGKEKKKWGLILFMVFIMIGTSFSFVFFGLSNVAEKAKYNKFTFTKNGNIWLAKISNNQAAFTFLPGDVENIKVPANLPSLLSNKLEIDATYDVNSSYKESIALALHQMGLTLATYNVYLRAGFTANNSFNLPIIACSDATQHIPVVYFKHGNETEIYENSSCIIAQASKDADFIRAKDRLLYSYFGVMK